MWCSCSCVFFVVLFLRIRFKLDIKTIIEREYNIYSFFCSCWFVYMFGFLCYACEFFKRRLHGFHQKTEKAHSKCFGVCVCVCLNICRYAGPILLKKNELMAGDFDKNGVRKTD